MLNITHHQGNTNQNKNEISLHTCQNGLKLTTQETTSIGKDAEKVELLHCWGECKLGQPLWKQYGVSSES